MSAPTRPRAPWYAAATRRLALVRVGLATAVACLLAATGPGAALSAPRTAAQGIAAVVSDTTAGVSSVLDPGPGGGDHGDGDGDADAR